ncbi:KfrB domain-containing protein [Burkholderia cenocepacia]|uniref:KfrB domain-containing protein n=1 Tax=Burkholderia cenocepacia TaxID=95486 RepID=UPI0013DED0B9|nr:hypothetical protein [Burkholderia cenocepacia]MCW3587412.1 hypothetical protein [Burkholderia cenocepacia]MCW3633892.1 hypothetical protein [Burkholderia cenocepacia]MCW5184794.1 hypothetical protein [Burkholderia cenocepacia]NGO98024.1 hypothetical protein [Burkholderia cenocepacia]
MDAKTFEQVVKGTNFAPASIEAARLVLVDGVRPGEAASRTGALPAHVSRTTKNIRERERKLNEAAALKPELAAIEKSLNASYTLAVHTAREKMGTGTELRAAEPGKQYVGTSVVQTDMHLVQDVGRGQLVIHELAKLERVPMLGASLEIRYGLEPLRPALVTERQLAHTRGGIAR